MTGLTELYRPRTVEQLGLWEVGRLRFKVYGILAQGQMLKGAMIDDARSFVEGEIPPLVEATGEDHGLGFVIVHPGDSGLSILGHWWIQGSVLCQHIRRRLWEAAEPMPPRPVVACVWELALIDAEQRIWRDTMMTPQPDARSYLDARAATTFV